MRKIRTQEEIGKKKKMNQLLIGGILILLMVVSTAGYSLLSRDSNSNSSGGSEKYGNYTFFRDQGMWGVLLNGESYYFQYLPGEVENISVSGDFSVLQYSGKVLYLVNNNPASQDILIDFNKYFLRAQGACLNNSLNGSFCEGDLPVKTCNDNVIIFENPDNETRVWQDKNCVYISGDFLMGADAFLYNALGIV